METEIGLMRCRYCNIALAPMRSLADGEFCCDDHRARFREPARIPEAVPEPEVPVARVEPQPEVPAALQMIRLKFTPPRTSPPLSPTEVQPAVAPAEIAFSKAPELPEAPPPVLAQTVELAAATPEPEVAAIEPEIAALEPEIEPEMAAPELEPVLYEASSEEPYEESFETAEEPADNPGFHPAREAARSWKWIHTAWKSAPRDLKLVTVVLPILAALAVRGSFPKVPIQSVAPAQVAQVQKAVHEEWKNVAQTISSRAAIAYADDFRSGLDAWESRSNLTTSWSYDAAGFVRPGPLALFKPSLDMADYRVEFLGEIDQRAIGWVFRAEDLKNYYAMKLVVVKPGPLPLVDLVRYAVIDGKEGPQIHKPLPMTVRADMIYRVMIDVRGADFTVMAQGQVVDFWTDHRLQHGGVGFFSNRGERARLRWVEVSHQYDALGRVCAYLAPFGLEGRNGSFN
jgi:hypothetical protein